MMLCTENPLDWKQHLYLNTAQVDVLFFSIPLSQTIFQVRNRKNNTTKKTKPKQKRSQEQLSLPHQIFSLFIILGKIMITLYIIDMFILFSPCEKVDLRFLKTMNSLHNFCHYPGQCKIVAI